MQFPNLIREKTKFCHLMSLKILHGFGWKDEFVVQERVWDYISRHIGFGKLCHIQYGGLTSYRLYVDGVYTFTMSSSLTFIFILILYVWCFWSYDITALYKSNNNIIIIRRRQFFSTYHATYHASVVRCSLEYITSLVINNLEHFVTFLVQIYLSTQNHAKFLMTII